MHDHARKLMKSTTLETLVSDKTKLARVVSALRESDFSSLTAANKFTSVITIVEAGSAGRGFSHVQVEIFLVYFFLSVYFIYFLVYFKEKNFIQKFD